MAEKIREVIEDRRKASRYYETDDARRYRLRKAGYKTFFLTDVSNQRTMPRDIGRYRYARKTIRHEWERAEEWAKKQIRADKATITMLALKEL